MITNKGLANKNSLILTIESLSHEGRGIAHHDGKPVFVTGALPGETVDVQIIRKNKRLLEGFAREIVQGDSERQNIRCQHFAQCGGCSLQHMAPERQIMHKESVFFEQLAHLAKTKPETRIPALTGPIWGYRYKARLSVRFIDGKDKICIGFRERNGRYITDMQSCPVLHTRFSDLVPALAQLVTALSCTREVPQFELAAGDNDIALIMRHLKPLTTDDIAICTQFATTHNVHFYTQSKGPKTIKRLWPADASQPERLTYSLPEQNCEMAFHPSDFTQINPAINRKMLQQAIALLNPQANETILDLFCGLGNFTLPFARHAKQVTGVEMSMAMVERGTENAKRNQITNVSFHQADLTEDWTGQSWAKQHYDSLIFDPPRSGALNIVKQIHHLQPKKIAYVSCHPATLARDAHCLVHEQGYRCTHAGVMDMFPHTDHVEAMAIFEK